MDKTIKKIIAAIFGVAGLYFLILVTRIYLREHDPPFIAHIVVPCFWMAYTGMMLMFYYVPWKRRKDLRQLALTSGHLFDPEAGMLPPLENTGLSLFLRGHSTEAADMLTPSADVPGSVWFFDYTYITGSGKTQARHDFTLGLFRLEKASFPVFELRPETLMDKLGAIIGFEDIDIPGFPEFSRKYLLKGKDPGAILAFFSPARINYFEQNPGWGVEAAGQYIAVYSGNVFQKVKTYPAFMASAKALVSDLTRA